jgi:DNA-binding MarR family transcriptional regulator
LGVGRNQPGTTDTLSGTGIVRPMSGGPSSELPPGRLALSLLRAADWLDDALLARLARDGWPELTRSQAQVFAHLDRHGTSIAELARRIGITRQSAHALVESLVGHGFVELRPDPDDRRVRLVVLSGEGARLVRRANRHLRTLEDELAERIGAGRVRALRRALAAELGPPPT